MEENEQAIVDWVNTFSLAKRCTALSELSDGLIIADILCEICPDYFEKDSLNTCADNWALAAGNWRKLLRSLDGYFTERLGKRVDVTHIDVNKIARAQDPDEIANLLELVVGAAVMCDRKEAFIGTIFGLNAHSQAVLKALVEQAMGRIEDLPEEEEGGGGGVGGGVGGDVGGVEGGQVGEMLQHLQAERVRLLAEVASLEAGGESLRDQLTAQREENQSNQRAQAQREVEGGSNLTRVAALEALNTKLKSELEESKREQDLQGVEAEALRREARQLGLKLEASRELQAKLEMESHQAADELDIARDRVAQLGRAEQSIEKYQKKLQEMGDVKRQNKELGEKMDHYLDQIATLEGSARGVGALSKMVESYKNRAVELETESFEMQSALLGRDEQIKNLGQDLSRSRECLKSQEAESADLRGQVESLVEAEERREEERREEEGRGSVGGLSMEDYTVETVPMLKERVKKLERELRQMGSASASGDISGAPGLVLDSSTSNTSNTTSDTTSNDLLEEQQTVLLLRAELEDVRRLKKVREDSLLEAKKKLSEVQYELGRQKDAEKVAAEGAAEELRGVAQRAAEVSNTVRLLEDRLKEREGAVALLTADKSKLENYTRRSLTEFKEKYMNVLSTLKAEKAELEERIRVMGDRHERNQSTWHREERLLASAMFEIGVRIMDNKIQRMGDAPTSTSVPATHSHLPPPAPATAPSTSFTAPSASTPAPAPPTPTSPSTTSDPFLETQRGALAQSSLDAAGSGSSRKLF